MQLQPQQPGDFHFQRLFSIQQTHSQKPIFIIYIHVYQTMHKSTMNIEFIKTKN